MEFDPNKRLSASEALLHPYFTSFEALNDISLDQREYASLASTSKMNGDTTIIEHDTNQTFLIPESSISKYLIKFNYHEKD